MDNSNNKLNIKEKLIKILKDPSFVEFCKKERNRPGFEENLKFAERIACINISDVKCDNNLIENKVLFNEAEVRQNVVEFYELIDALSPNGISLSEAFEKNKKYFKFGIKENGARSFCKVIPNKNGELNREIYVNFECRVGDTGTAIHEFAHSFSEVFMSGEKQTDSRVTEIPTVITDKLSSEFLAAKYPQYRGNFVENEKFSQILNVKKARECLLDALIIKVATKEETLDAVIEKFGYLFKDYPNLIMKKIKDIESYNFHPLYELRYLVPQMVALEIKDHSKTEPQDVAEQLKYLIQNNHCLTEEQVLAYLNLPPKEQLADEYIKKFPSRMKNFCSEKENAKRKEI